MGDDGNEDDDEDEDGSNALPQVLIMNHIAQIKEKVNMDDIEGTVQNVIGEYMTQLRISRGQGPHDMMDAIWNTMMTTMSLRKMTTTTMKMRKSTLSMMHRVDRKKKTKTR